MQLSKKLIATSSVLVAILTAVTAWNHFSAYRPLQKVISSDTRNKGISAISHHEYLVNKDVLIFDLRSVGNENSPMDVTRVLLQFAQEMKDHEFKEVILEFKGQPKFKLQGSHFKELGIEFGSQNPIYTIRTLPENLYRPNGEPAFGSWTGGLFGVVGKQMEDFNDFHKQWYIADLAGG